MRETTDGGCLCGRIRYEVLAEPEWITVCYCAFCQRATGSDRMIEPIFQRGNLQVTRGAPKVFSLPSAGSGKLIHVHFCQDCGSKLLLTFERWPEYVGLYAGTLDEPARVPVTPENGWQIFVSEARPETVILGGLPTYLRHAQDNDDNPLPEFVPEGPMRADSFRARYGGAMTGDPARR